ncbi:12678_t:CDS:2 [Funneliformis mosseae]|uniref:DASH complex subunit DAD1 n=1 Tax=Funneliformis mosseae TaxID=27381 RepID=A0A9N8V671_FUNMO|nr:12678_t:CDS:2 [Funneliformis mosseae]
MESSDRTTFQKQRDNLINDIVGVLEQVINNMAILNKNLESIVAVGKDFENVATPWKNFHDAIIAGALDADLKDDNPITVMATAGLPIYGGLPSSCWLSKSRNATSVTLWEIE